MISLRLNDPKETAIDLFAKLNLTKNFISLFPRYSKIIHHFEVIHVNFIDEKICMQLIESKFRR